MVDGKDINSAEDSYKFTYSSKNQLIKTEVFAGAGAKIREVTYVYDVLGRRMQKTLTDLVDTASITKNYTRKYGYDGQNIFVEFDSANNLLARHTHNPATLDDILSTHYSVHAVNAGIAQIAGNYHYMKDHLGSINAIVNTNGDVIQKYDYKSFGKIISVKDENGADITSSPVIRNAFTYTGREYEPEVDLFYYRARWYSPTTGRFLQSDPDPGRVIDPSSFNSKYIYAQNNPIMFSDPTGKGILEALGVLLTGFLAIVSGLWIGGLIHGLVGGSFWGGILGGVLGGIAGGALGSQIGGVVMGLAYQGEGRNYSDGQRMGMQIGGLVGGFFGSLAGAGNMNLDDFWGSFSKKSQCLAMSTPMGAAGSLIKRGVLGGTKSGLSNGELPENLRPDIEGQPHRLKPWEHPSSVPDISVPHNLNNSMQCPLS